MSLANAYFSEAAFPILASSLLSEPLLGEAKEHPGKEVHNASSRRDDHPARQWSLKSDIERGIGSSEDSIFRSGTITGFSRLREGSGDEDQGRVGEVSR
jgi:hypothetical protein